MGEGSEVKVVLMALQYGAKMLLPCAWRVALGFDNNLTGHWRGGGGEMGGGSGGRGGGRGGNREMDRPWVTPALRQEMLKTKVSLLLKIFID